MFRCCSSPPKFFQSIVLLLFAAFAVRAVAAVGLQIYLDRQPNRDFLIAGDAEGYWQLAKNIAAGEPYEVHDPPRRILRMPGFPLVLAIPIRLADSSFLATRLWLACMGTFAVWLCYRLACLLVDRPVALVAGWITALHPVFAGFSVLILSETCFAAALLASLISLRQLESSGGSVLKPLVAGLLVAGATYMRPVWLLFPILWAVYQLLATRDFRRTLRQILFIAVGMAIGLAPWTYRNYRVSGHLIPTTLWVGPSLYDGLNPEATGASDMQFFDRDQLPESMTEYEVDREYRARAWRFARENPGRAVELAGAKAVRYWRPWPASAEVSHPAVVVLIGAVNTVAFLLVIIGIWHFRRQGSRLFYTLAPLFYFAAIHLIFVGSLRYRLPAEYPLMILVGIAMVKCLCSSKIERGSVAGDLPD